MSRPVHVRSTSADVRATWAALTGGVVWLLLWLMARNLISRYEDQLPGDPRKRRRSHQMVCADCDRRISPEEGPAGQLICPRCGGQNLRER
jgi:uncharacterized paraquat-inducible protein A